MAIKRSIKEEERLRQRSIEKRAKSNRAIEKTIAMTYK